MTPSLDVFWHEDCLLHDTGRGVFGVAGSELIEIPELHPENAVRIKNIKSVLERGPLKEHIRWREGRYAERSELEMLHDPAYIDSIRKVAEEGGGEITNSTFMSERSYDAALASAGTALAAAQAVLDGETTMAYALVRPPGHHAQPAQVDGYCFFNNVALCAELARRRGVERVAIVDWDVHHGNGTQECFYRRNDVLTISLHMRHGSWGPSHPQTGSAEEAGLGEGEGYNANLELPVGTGDRGYEEAMAEVAVPILDQFHPGLVIVAAGQDASQFDPNGRQCVSMRGFHRLGGFARQAAESHSGGKLVLVQEGGYGLTYSGFCMHATLEGCLGLDRGLRDPVAYMPDDFTRGREGITATKSALSRFWAFP